MRNLISILLSIICFGCSQSKSNRQSEISYLYIYEHLSDIPSDSLLVHNTNLEKSLEFYTDTESIEKQAQGLVYLSIFKLNNEKFSIIIDTLAVKVFEFKNKKFNKVIEIKAGIGMPKVKTERVDFNADGFEDVIIEIPSGGLFGSSDFFIFFNPQTRKLIYDDKIEFRNYKLDIGNQFVTSFEGLVNKKYAIKNYTFILREKAVDLGMTTNLKELENKSEISIYDLKGRFIKRDTI